MTDHLDDRPVPEQLRELPDYVTTRLIDLNKSVLTKGDYKNTGKLFSGTSFLEP